MKIFTLPEDAGLSPKIDYAKELNREQLAVVSGASGPVLVLAGAGSGKTRTLVYRVAYLLEHGVRPSEILLMTFTNKAAREMMDRVSALLKQPLAGLWGGTFHHICHRLLRQSGSQIGLASNFTILDEEDAKDLIKIIVKERGSSDLKDRFPSPAVLKAMISYAGNASRPLAGIIEERFPHFSSLIPEVEAIRSAYQEKKRTNNSLDFDDLLIYTVELLSKSEPTRSRYAGQFKYVLVDEFQDTNALQAKIVALLASVHGNLMVVGDDAQSIYSFRAADIHNILDFPSKFPNTKIFKLETNYRSVSPVLELANEVIAGNQQGFRKELKGVRAGGEKPFLVPAASAREEAVFVTEMIAKLIQDGVPMSEIAVLFRATHHSQLLEFELMKRDLAYEYRGGLKFFERAHIKDTLSFLRIIHNLRDEIAWLRVLQFGRGIGPAAARTAYEAVKKAEGLEDSISCLESSLKSKALSGWQELKPILLKTSSVESPAEKVRAVAASKYQDILQSLYPNWEERVDDLEQLAVFAERYDSLQEFLADVSLQDGLTAWRGGARTTGEDKVILSTIHQAKGLEWNSVFVIHLADKFFPNPRALNEKFGLEEERRLFYVAVTRAKQNLFLSYPAVVGEESLSLVQPSVFIDEISPRLLERLELRVGKKTQFKSDDSIWEEEAIELDDNGEILKKGSTKPRSFLRDVDELGC
ncbi:MAG: ATP-dependent helicase [bacterium]